MYRNKILIISFSFVGLLATLFFITNCGNSRMTNIKEDPLIEKSTGCIVDSLEISEHPIINVYLENSGSMNGYVDNGRTSFQVAVFNYLTHVKHSQIPSEMNLNFINSQIIKKGSVIDDFINKLTPHSFSQSMGNRSTTDIADIFRQILERTDGENMSILISDCIFSPGSTTNPQAYLAGQQVGIMNCVSDYITNKGQIAILVYQLYSDFNGVYYDYKNRPRQYQGMRPYYVWIIGHPQHVMQLKTAIPNDRFIGGGVANSWCAHNMQSEVNYNVAVRESNYKKVNRNTISNARKVNGMFTLRINADLQNLEMLLGEDYLIDSNNYYCQINSNQTDAWLITVAKLSNVSRPLHSLTLSTNSNLPRGNISINIKCKTPEWAYSLTDMDDSEFSDDNCLKTYGLQYIFDGIQQAYIAKSSDTYTTININIQ